MSQRDSESPGPPLAQETPSEPIASTKLLPPRGARRLMPREALIARLQDARRQRCVVLQGPAGSGKTSTLVAWRRALLALDYDAAWLSLAPEDDELARFFDCLLASLAEVDPALGQETRLLMGRDSDESAVEHWVITLVQEVARRPRELMVMLDDVQNLDDARIFEALQWLLEYAPPNLHLVFGSRHPIPLPLAIVRLRGQGLLSEFDLRDLRFSAEESERFLREQLGHIDPRDARELHALTDGWVAGLQLFAVDLKTKQGNGYARVEVRDAQGFASYFEREVLVRLAPDDLDLLTRMAGCNRFCASLCATLLGQPQAVARMSSRLAQLDTDNLFISQVSSHDRESWYRLHPLLREVLLARLARRPPEELRALHHAAWRWFEGRGHLDEAVRHAVQAGEAPAAADLVESCAIDLLAAGELTQLGNLMRRLPQEELHTRFRLRIAKAHLLLYGLRTDELRRELEQLETQFGTLAARQRYGITLLRGGLALQSDDTSAGRALLPALEVIPDDAEAHAFAGRNHVMAWIHMSEGNYAVARRLLDESAALAHPGRILLGQTLGALCLMLQGQMSEAESMLRGVLQTARQRGAAELGVVCVASALLGEVLYEQNDLDAVCELLEPRIELLQRASIPDAVSRALLVLCCAYWLKGRYLDALDCLERLEDYGTRHALDRPLAYALALRLRWQLRRGETVQAQATIDRLVLLAARQEGRSSSAAAEIRRMAERARAEMSLHWNDFDAAAVRLGTVLADTEAAARARSVAGLHAQLACAESGRGNAVAARRHLVEALRMGHRLGLTRTLLDVSRHVPRLLEELLQGEPFDPVLAYYARRVLAAAAQWQQGPAAPARSAAAAIESFSEREREVLDLVAQALPNKKIARVLGITPHTVKWHLRKIYAKLGVAERDEAVARLRDLELGRENTGGPGSTH